MQYVLLLMPDVSQWMMDGNFIIQDVYFAMAAPRIGRLQNKIGKDSLQQAVHCYEIRKQVKYEKWQEIERSSTIQPCQRLPIFIYVQYDDLGRMV